LIRGAQVQDLSRIVASIKSDWPKPSFEALAIEPLFDGVKDIIPKPTLNCGTHNLRPSGASQPTRGLLTSDNKSYTELFNIAQAIL
jgi:hypothetical protein